MKIYKLYHDTSINGDYDDLASLYSDVYDASFIGGEFYKLEKLNFNSRIYYGADLEVLKYCDYPNNDTHIPILSKKMIDVIIDDSVKKFELIPVTLFDFTIEYPFDMNGELKKVVNKFENYFGLHIYEYSDVVDDEKSVLRYSPFDPDKVIGYTKPYFKTNVNYPSIFRIKNSSAIYVTENTMLKIMNNNIKGCLF